MYSVEKKLKHLKKHFQFQDSELGEIKKMYEGRFFDPSDRGYRRLLRISEQLCKEFSELNGRMGKGPSLFQVIGTYLRKNKILDLLFPGHGMLSGIGEHISTVIGLVDFKGCGFTNRAVTFSPYSLVECENYSIFATKIKVGAAEPERKGDLIRLSRVHIGKNTWICAGVTIDGGVSIGNGSVIGAGATVSEDIPANVVAVGRPAKPSKEIDASCSLTHSDAPPMDAAKKARVMQRMRKLGYRHGLREYVKMLEGKYFNSTNLRLGALFILTHRLCSELNAPNTAPARKAEILDILFPDHGENLTVGEDLFVDMLGMTEVGDNVTIGNGVYLSGPVTLESGAAVGDDTLLFGTGHSLLAKERKVGFSLKHGMYEFSQSKPITVRENVTVGAHCVLVPGATVTEDAPDGSLCIKDKIL